MSIREETKLELLQQAQALPPDQLPRFFGDLEEIVRTAELRATGNAQVPGTDELLDVAQASKLLGVSKDKLYRNTYVFTRRMGRRLLFSRDGMNEAILNNDLQPLQTNGNVTHSSRIPTKPKRAFRK